MTGVLMKRGNLNTETGVFRGKTMSSRREKVTGIGVTLTQKAGGHQMLAVARKVPPAEASEGAWPG